MQQFWGGQLNSEMMTNAAFFALVFLVITAVLFLARRIAFSAFERWARKTDTRADDFIIDSVRQPSVFWVFATSIYITIATSGLPPKFVNYGLKALYVLIILSVTLAVANIASKLVQGAIEKSSPGVAVTGLSKAVIKVVILGLGLLIMLNGLGVSITPMLTALGVGGLAVALALQDSLSNLFAGIHLLMERPIRVGDYIKISSGEEGFVSDIGWRTTRLRQPSNNIVIVPNNKLSTSTITNYHLPMTSLSFPIQISVSYSSDPEHVEKVLVDEAGKAVGEVPGLLAEPAPLVRFIPGFGPSSLDFTLICQVADYTDQALVQHELRKRIFRRFREEGIEFPFPTHTVYLKK
ncbi:Small-conductance mechanosensitive channel [uncultured bacterium]|nr:Small-conductance mechanosensitive channel [uncultured bacterium]